jgi:hypothetical protein
MDPILRVCICWNFPVSLSMIAKVAAPILQSIPIPAAQVAGQIASMAGNLAGEAEEAGEGEDGVLQRAAEAACKAPRGGDARSTSSAHRTPSQSCGESADASRGTARDPRLAQNRCQCRGGERCENRSRPAAPRPRPARHRRRAHPLGHDWLDESEVVHIDRPFGGVAFNVRAAILFVLRAANVPDPRACNAFRRQLWH